MIPTTVTIFFKEVDKYQFRTIPKLKDLPTEKINILITHTLAMDTPYTIAMLNHLEYIKHLQYSYSLTKEQIYKHLSEALNGVSKRRIKGNFLVLNPSSEEDRQTYTACKHVDEVKEYYDSLVNT